MLKSDFQVLPERRRWSNGAHPETSEVAVLLQNGATRPASWVWFCPHGPEQSRSTNCGALVKLTKVFRSLSLAAFVATLATARPASAAPVTLFDAIPAAPGPTLGGFFMSSPVGILEVGQQITIGPPGAGVYTNVIFSALLQSSWGFDVTVATMTLTLYEAPANLAPGSNAGPVITSVTLTNQVLSPDFNIQAFSLGTLNLPGTFVYGLFVSDSAVAFSVNGDGGTQYSGPGCTPPNCAQPTVGGLPVFSDPDFTKPGFPLPSGGFLRVSHPNFANTPGAAAQAGNFTADCCLPVTTAVRLTGNQVTTAPVPEPGTLVLFASGLIGVGVAGYRKRRARA